MRYTPATWVWEDRPRVLVVTGSIDESVIDDFRLTVYSVTDRYRLDLTVDLEAVTFMPSMAIGVLASAGRQLAENGRSITLRTLAGSLADQVLTISGIPHERVDAPGGSGE